MYKGFEVGVCVLCIRNIMEVIVVGVEGVRGRKRNSRWVGGVLGDVGFDRLLLSFWFLF